MYIIFSLSRFYSSHSTNTIITLAIIYCIAHTHIHSLHQCAVFLHILHFHTYCIFTRTVFLNVYYLLPLSFLLLPLHQHYHHTRHHLLHRTHTYTLTAPMRCIFTRTAFSYVLHFYTYCIFECILSSPSLVFTPPTPPTLSSHSPSSTASHTHIYTHCTNALYFYTYCIFIRTAFLHVLYF